jgi:protein tyrosine phosphatase (PTP) superfamily phosphohydrolase (DUF442 family)
MLCAGVIYGYWVVVDHRLTVVTSGQVYQSAEMPPRDLVRVAQRLGIKTVFDFRGDADQDPRVVAERGALESNGVKYIHLPSSIRPAPETVASFVHAMQVEVAAHRTVLLHCHDGEGRAVFYSAVYRMEFEGWDNRRAYQATTRLPPSLMFLSELFPAVGRLSPKNAKTPLILSYRPSMHSEVASAARP